MREDTIANVTNAGDGNFNDAALVAAAKDWHEAKLLAEGGFKTSPDQLLEQRHVSSKLSARLQGLGRESENRVAGVDSSAPTDDGEKAIASSAAEYGSADHHQAFAASLAGTASENQVQSGPSR